MFKFKSSKDTTDINIFENGVSFSCIEKQRTPLNNEASTSEINKCPLNAFLYFLNFYR